MRSYSCMAEGILPWARYFSAARMAFALPNPIRKLYPPEGSVNEYRREANRQRQGACGPAVSVLSTALAPAPEDGQILSLHALAAGGHPSGSQPLYPRPARRNPPPRGPL